MISSLTWALECDRPQWHRVVSLQVLEIDPEEERRWEAVRTSILWRGNFQRSGQQAGSHNNNKHNQPSSSFKGFGFFKAWTPLGLIARSWQRTPPQQLTSELCCHPSPPLPLVTSYNSLENHDHLFAATLVEAASCPLIQNWSKTTEKTSTIKSYVPRHPLPSYCHIYRDCHFLILKLLPSVLLSSQFLLLHPATILITSTPIWEGYLPRTLHTTTYWCILTLTWTNSSIITQNIYENETVNK